MTIGIFVLVAGLSFSWSIADYRKHGVRPRQLIVVWYGIYFGVVPPFTLENRAVWSTRFYRQFTPESFSLSAWMCLLGLLVMIAVFSAMRKPAVAPDSANSGATPVDSHRNQMVFLLLIGLGTVSASIFLNGGLSEVAGNISELRSTSDGSGVRVVAAALMLGRHFILLSAIYFSLKPPKSSIARHSRSLAFIAWFASVFLALISGGRGTAIGVLIAALLAALANSRRIPAFRGAIVAVLAFFMVLYGKTIFFQLTNSDFSKQDASAIVATTQSEGEFSVFLREFTHPFLSLAQAIDIEYDYRLFGDYWYWAVKPLKLIGMSPPDSISYFNTYLTWGSWDSEVPPGLVAFGFLSLGVVGVIIHAAVVAAIASTLERILYSGRSLLGVALGIQTAIVAPSVVSASDPALLVQNYFVLLLPLWWVVAAGRRSRRAPEPAPTARTSIAPKRPRDFEGTSKS